MLLSSAAVLASCVNEEQPTESEKNTNTETETKPGDEKTETDTESDKVTESQTESGSTTETDSSTETETETETETGKEPELPEISYGNGGKIDKAGVVWSDAAFALTDNVIDESKAVTKSAAEMLALLANKDGAKKGEVYKVTEPLVLDSDTTYYGNLAAVIAEGGIVIENVDDTVVKELIVKGNITIKGSNRVEFFKLDLKSAANGVTIDSKSSNISFEECRITAAGTAIVSDAYAVSVYKSYISADKGITSTGSEFIIQSSQIDAKSLGISSCGSDCTVRECTITADSDAVGVDFAKGSSNGLIALNVIKDAQMSISVIDGYNCVVLMNSAISTVGKNNTNLYVVKNSLGGVILLSDNKYLLCDENKFANDGKDHALLTFNNSEFNGNNIQDVNARVDYGTNEDVLPHTNKDLFVGMERKDAVKDLSLSKAYAFTFNRYVLAKAREDSVVIVPPGAYCVPNGFTLDAGHSNTDIYAFGVYFEKDSVKEGATRPNSMSDLGELITIVGSSIHIHGLTFGYDFQTLGQVYIVDKWSDSSGKYVRVVPNAGFYDAFRFSGDADELYGYHIQFIKGDEYSPWVLNPPCSFVKRDTDGTMIYKFDIDADTYNKLEKGDVVACRLGGENLVSITIKGEDTLLKDCVIYGYTSGMIIFATGRNVKNVRLERFHSTSKSAPVIDKRTYDKYKALEKKYGLTSDGDAPLAEGAQGLEVYIDEQGRYRGGLPRIGGVDGIHNSGGAEGVSVTSSIFEQIADDGANQRGSSSRLAGIVDNGDGTTTVYFKGVVARVYYSIAEGNASTTEGGYSGPGFKAGDTIYLYRSNGEKVIEAPVLSDSELAGALPDDSKCHMLHTDKNNDCICDYAACKAVMHTDLRNNKTGADSYDCLCDKCGKAVHSDYNKEDDYFGIGDGKCNNRFCTKSLTDANNDGYNDSDGAYIIKDMAPAGSSSYDPTSSKLSFQMLGRRKYDWRDLYVITYSPKVYKVTVKTEDVNFDALKGVDFTDNEYFLDQKVVCDNMSLNSAGYTYDNVRLQNGTCRGLIVNTRDVTYKSCTFKNFLMGGMLATNDLTWGEASVPKNLTVEGCLFDNTGRGHEYGKGTGLEYSQLSLNAEGGGTCAGKEISENNLTGENIKLIGNKFINTNTPCAVAILDSINVEIKDNVIECRTTVDENGKRVEDTKNGRAIFLERCMNVTVSGNTFIYGGDKVEKGTHIIAWDYRNLNGDDLYDESGNRFASLPENKTDKRPGT